MGNKNPFFLGVDWMNKVAYYLEKSLLIAALLIAIINALLYWFDYKGNYMISIIVVFIIFLALSIKYLFRKNKGWYSIIKDK